MATDASKLVIEVTAGLIPGEPDTRFTRRWILKASDWEQVQQLDRELVEAGDLAHAFHAALRLAFLAAEADEYARLLRNPARFNYVRTEWLWL